MYSLSAYFATSGIFLARWSLVASHYFCGRRLKSREHGLPRDAHQPQIIQYAFFAVTWYAQCVVSIWLLKPRPSHPWWILRMDLPTAH